MKKKKKNLLILIIILIVLGVVAVLAQKSSGDNTEEDVATDESDIVTVFDNNFQDIVGMTMSDGTNTWEYEVDYTETRGDWNLVGDDMELNDTELDLIAKSVATLRSDDEITDADAADYGITGDVYTSVTYADGHTDRVNLGDQTPDGFYYYITVNDDPNIYYFTKVSGNRFYETYDDLVDKTIPAIDPSTITEFSVTSRDGDDFAVIYDGDGSADEYGSVVLSMTEPYENTSVYYEKLSEEVLQYLANLEFTDFIENNAADLSVYGLDDPYLSIYVKGMEEESYTLHIGNSVPDEDKYYAMLNDSNDVFTIDKSLIEPFENIDALGLVDRFINLENIADVSEVNITYGDSQYTLLLNYVTEGEGDDAVDVMHPTINGTEISEDDFKDLYQYVIALSYDSPIDPLPPEYFGDPAMNITFTYSDGDIKSTNYYDYNADYYGISKDGNDINFVSNKADVAEMIRVVDALANGQTMEDIN